VLLCERLLLKDKHGVYLQGAVSFALSRGHVPIKVYCSPHNLGADVLAMELNMAVGSEGRGTSGTNDPRRTESGRRTAGESGRRTDVIVRTTDSGRRTDSGSKDVRRTDSGRRTDTSSLQIRCTDPRRTDPRCTDPTSTWRHTSVESASRHTSIDEAQPATNASRHTSIDEPRPSSSSPEMRPSRQRSRQSLKRLATQKLQKMSTAPHLLDIKEDISACDHMLLYLNAHTWANDPEALDHDILEAQRLGVNIVVCHEFPSVIDPGSARSALDFKTIMNATPPHLMSGQRNLYRQIAVPLKGGELRKVGLDSLAAKLVRCVPRAPQDINIYGRQSTQGTFTQSALSSVRSSSLRSSLRSPSLICRSPAKAAAAVPSSLRLSSSNAGGPSSSSSSSACGSPSQLIGGVSNVV